MADKKISALTASTTPLAGTEVLPIVQGGSTVKVAVSNLTAGRAVSATQLTLSTDNLIFSTTGKGVTTGSAIPLGLGVNNSVAAITIDTGSNVGVGTASPITKFDVYSATDTYAAVRTAAQTMAFNAGTGFTGSAATSIYNLSAVPMVFGTNSSPRITISAAGDVTVNTGNLVIGTAAKGIDFSANGGDVLSQYDEGTFTPVITGSTTDPTFTYTRQRGKYVRVGNLVTVSVDLIWSAISGGSGDARLSLPFAGEGSVGASGAGPIAVLDGVTFAALRTFCNVQPQPSVAYATLPQAGSAVATSNTTIAQLAASGRLVISCTYLV
jgi:hypothetical protein